LRDKAWPAKDVAPLVELVADPRSRIKDGEIRLTEEQAKAILDLRLHRLTALGRDEIGDEANKLAETIADCWKFSQPDPHPRHHPQRTAGRQSQVRRGASLDHYRGRSGDRG
jgi:hypothetical protein